MRYRVVDEPPSRGDGPKTVVELDGVGVGAFARDDRFAGIVTSLRVSETTTGTRVALALDGVGYRRVFHLLEPFRVIVDIAREPPRVRAERGPRPVRRVVLDPGHGGSDPGAIGATGLREKDVTLDLAHRIAPVLAGEGIEVALTRDDDRFVALEERTARANGFNADLFVSIHCNAAENTARHGIETYVLDTTSDAIAARVAARENATSPGAAAELGGILASLRFADHASRSTRLAELFQKATRASAVQFDASVRDGGVKTAGFYVLVGARMPSVLFEANYLSNPEDEARLRSAEYRSRLADGVVNAIRAYREGR
jgi:N-acetylmuramoyl-L-alanine amidase